MKRYKKYITPYLSAFVIGPLMMLTEVAGEVMLPKFMSMIINNGVASRNVAYIGKMGALMVLTVLFMAVGGILGAYFSAKASISFTSDMRNDLFQKVQQFSFENIDGYSTGSLVTRLTNDVQQVQTVLMMGLRMALRAPGMFLGALIMAFMMNRQLAVIILIVIPLLLAAIILILKTAFPRFGEMQRRLDRLNSGIQESLTNVRVVKSFVREDHEIEKFSRLNRDLKESSLRALRIDHYDAGDDVRHERDDTGCRLVRRKYHHCRKDAGGGSHCVYDVYRADPDVPHDAFHGILTELPRQRIHEADQ
ncbi:MAG: ABC transporter permease [Pilosibacter sp.]